MITEYKIIKYFRDNGIDEKEIRRLKYSNANEKPVIDFWPSDIPRPDDSYWATAESYFPVPSQVTPRQFRLALIQSGRDLDEVEQAINAIPDTAERQTAQVEWEYASVIKRNHPFVISLGAAIGFTPEEIDDAFRLAATL